MLSGFEFAISRRYKKIITIDADFQHNSEHIPFFLENLDATEVVLGSRYLTKSRFLKVPIERLIINRYIANLIYELFSFYFADPFCGFRGCRDFF